MIITSQAKYPVGSPTIFYLDSVGDGTGTVNAIGNYAVTPQAFKRNIPIGMTFALYRIQIMIGTTALLRVNGYGNQVAPLTNGLIFSGKINGVPFTSTAGAFKTNADYSARGTSTEVHALSGSDQFFEVYQDFIMLGDGPITLYGNKGDFIQYLLNDDFTFLAQHRFTIFGVAVSG